MSKHFKNGSRGATAVEIAILCALVMMACMAAVGRVGFNSAKQFCRPSQALQFSGNLEGLGYFEDTSTGEFRCEDEFSANIEGWLLNKTF